MPFFTYPLAWIAAITLPALIAIYFLRHRFRKQSVSTLLLWQMHQESREGGRRIEKPTLPLVFFLELLRVFHHAVDVGLVHAGAGLNDDFLLFAGALVLGGYTQDATGVDVKRDLDLGNPSGGGQEAIQLEPADGLVIRGHRALALQDVDVHGGLAVGGRRKRFVLLGGNGGVPRDEGGHHATQSLQSKG